MQNPNLSDDQASKKDQLVVCLRGAAVAADLLGYPESVATLTAAVGKVLHPEGFETAAEAVDFYSRETPVAHLDKHVATGGEEEDFRRDLEQARAYADALGLHEITDLIEDASTIHTVAQRAASALSPDSNATDMLVALTDVISGFSGLEALEILMPHATAGDLRVPMPGSEFIKLILDGADPNAKDKQPSKPSKRRNTRPKFAK